MSKKSRKQGKNKQDTSKQIMQELQKILRSRYQCTEHETRLVIEALSQRFEHVVAQELMQQFQELLNLQRDEGETQGKHMQSFLLKGSTEETFRLNVHNPHVVLYQLFHKHYRDTLADLLLVALNYRHHPQEFLHFLKEKENIKFLKNDPQIQSLAQEETL